MVGPGISFHGDIAACEGVTVDGAVDATLHNCGTVQIGETGLLIGRTKTKKADIAGCYEGDLTVSELLRIRSTGRVTGTIRYGSLEVDQGGQIVGDVGMIVAG